MKLDAIAVFAVCMIDETSPETLFGRLPACESACFVQQTFLFRALILGQLFQQLRSAPQVRPGDGSSEAFQKPCRCAGSVEGSRQDRIVRQNKGVVEAGFLKRLPDLNAGDRGGSCFAQERSQ